VLIVETPRRRPARYSRRVERRLIATARQAAAQSASAVGRSLATMKLAEAANTDGLTGLTNRARFDVLLAERAAGTQPFSVILLDLDHFKNVNDTYGHQAGDGVLQGVAAALRTGCRAGDVVARYGGEELVVLADGDADETKDTAERLRAAVAAAATPVPVTASIGAAWGPADGRTPEALLDAADRRLYIAKRTGRNRSVTAADEALTESGRLG
jgi:diguanylate cyclase (GGDEF)-like protein